MREPIVDFDRAGGRSFASLDDYSATLYPIRFYTRRSILVCKLSEALVELLGLKICRSSSESELAEQSSHPPVSFCISILHRSISCYGSVKHRSDLAMSAPASRSVRCVNSITCPSDGRAFSDLDMTDLESPLVSHLSGLADDELELSSVSELSTLSCSSSKNSSFDLYP